MSTNGLKSMFFSQFLGWINQKLWWMSLEFPAFFGEMMENAPFHHDDVFLSSFPYVLGSSKLEAEIGSWIQIAGMVAISPVLNHDWHCLIPWKRGCHCTGNTEITTFCKVIKHELGFWIIATSKKVFEVRNQEIICSQNTSLVGGFNPFEKY